MCNFVHFCTCALFPTMRRHPTLLPQAAEGKLGRAYEYHRAPAPFVQLELLRLLGLLGAGDRAASENMYAVVAEVKRRAEPLGNNIGERACGRWWWCGGRWVCGVLSSSHITATPTPYVPLPPTACLPRPCPRLPSGNAIVYECIRTLTAIHPNAVLVGSAAESVARFLGARENNLRYAGIDALTRLVRIDPKYAQVCVCVCVGGGPSVYVRMHVCVYGLFGSAVGCCCVRFTPNTCPLLNPADSDVNDGCCRRTTSWRWWTACARPT